MTTTVVHLHVMVANAMQHLSVVGAREYDMRRVAEKLYGGSLSWVLTQQGEWVGSNEDHEIAVIKEEPWEIPKDVRQRTVSIEDLLDVEHEIVLAVDSVRNKRLVAVTHFDNGNVKSLLQVKDLRESGSRQICLITDSLLEAVNTYNELW